MSTGQSSVTVTAWFAAMGCVVSTEPMGSMPDENATGRPAGSVAAPVLVIAAVSVTENGELAAGSAESSAAVRRASMQVTSSV